LRLIVKATMVRLVRVVTKEDKGQLVRQVSLGRQDNQVQQVCLELLVCQDGQVHKVIGVLMVYRACPAVRLDSTLAK
jgi:hypothetical protein